MAKGKETVGPYCVDRITFKSGHFWFFVLFFLILVGQGVLQEALSLLNCPDLISTTGQHKHADI